MICLLKWNQLISKVKMVIFSGIVDIMVKNKIHIKKLIDRLKKIDGIKKLKEN